MYLVLLPLVLNTYCPSLIEHHSPLLPCLLSLVIPQLWVLIGIIPRILPHSHKTREGVSLLFLWHSMLTACSTLCYKTPLYLAVSQWAVSAMEQNHVPWYPCSPLSPRLCLTLTLSGCPVCVGKRVCPCISLSEHMCIHRRPVFCLKALGFFPFALVRPHPDVFLLPHGQPHILFSLDEGLSVCLFVCSFSSSLVTKSEHYGDFKASSPLTESLDQNEPKIGCYFQGTGK